MELYQGMNDYEHDSHCTDLKGCLNVSGEPMLIEKEIGSLST